LIEVKMAVPEKEENIIPRTTSKGEFAGLTKAPVMAVGINDLA
jgi:hypothetical protein